MSEAARPDPDAMMASLRECGADRFDPVRFRFIEALARRAGAYRGAARRLLDGKLACALAEYAQGFECAKRDAGDTLRRASAQFPDAAEELHRLFSAGDFKGLHRLVAKQEAQCRPASLADLAGHFGQHAPEKATSAPADGQGAVFGPQTELKSLSYFRDTWSRLSVDQQLAQALAQAPENAGPLNSHLLVLQSLKLMRAISPDYLNHFVSYVDALLWLDQANGFGLPAPKNSQRGDSDKKRKSGRAKSG